MNDAETGVENNTRIKRAAPQRQAPLRRPPLGLPASMGTTLNGALGAALDSGQVLSTGLGAAVRQGLDSGRLMGGAAEAGVQGFVERGVNTAYQVIEEYMRRGQEMAQRLSPQGPEPARNGLAADAANAWVQNLAGPLGQTASSLAAPWMQLVQAWLEGLSTAAPMAGPLGDLNPMGVLNRFTGQGAARPSAWPAGATAASASQSEAPAAASAAPAAAPRAAGPGAKVTIEFMSRQPAEVAVTLEPGADLAALQAHWSEPEEATAVPGSVVLYSAPGHVHVRLSLAQPPVPGHHVATLTDSQGQSWGSVSVVIAERHSASPGAPAA